MLGIGHGGTWPGEIMLRADPRYLEKKMGTVKKGIVLVAGTNGKTTTSAMIRTILLKSGACTEQTLVQNSSGANLLNGIASAFIQHSNWAGSAESDYVVLEVDENALPLILDQVKNKEIVIILLNLFRDQLDRYGEVDSIRAKWHNALLSLPESATVILNADDPGIAYLGKNTPARVIYFGVNSPKDFLPTGEHTADTSHCPSCGDKLAFSGVYFSHIGHWRCPSCGFHRPMPSIVNWRSPLPGLYNEYNALAAAGAATTLQISKKAIESGLAHFSPAFGRQEEIRVGKKTVKIFLSKNPASFNASLRTIVSLQPKTLLLVLNDRIPDGRDVSWIWDTDIESIPDGVHVIVSGDRAWDMGLRVKYAREGKEGVEVIEALDGAIHEALEKIKDGETLYVLPTYSAMLDVRKILTGRKIL